MHTEKDLKIMIKKAELRVTAHRMDILYFLSRVRAPVTVYELVRALRKKSNIDQATVYRNLASLQDAGLLRRLDFNHGHAHYQLETGKPTNSLVCSNCENIENIDGVATDDVIKKLIKKSKKFKSLTKHSIEVYGLCKNCA